MMYILAVVVVLLLISYLLERTAAAFDWSGFNQRFPPISDDEFIARCRPGVNRDTALRVRSIVAEQLGVPYERIYPSSRFVEDLGAD
jgi:hypothetical protein